MKDRQDRYVELYNKVEDGMIKNKLAKEFLMEICSFWLDREGNENQVNIELLLETSMKQKIEVKKLFDDYSQDFGFSVNYGNVFGDLPTDWQ